MPISVDIDGLGTVEFPDGMSQEDIGAAIEKELPRHQKGIDLRSQLASARSEVSPMLNRAGLAVSEFPEKAMQFLDKPMPEPDLSYLLPLSERLRGPGGGPMGPYGEVTPEQERTLQESSDREKLADWITEKEHPIRTGLGRAAGNLAEGLTKPSSLVLGAATMVAPEITAPIWMTMGASQLRESAKQIQEAREEGDRAKYYEGVGNLAASLGQAIPGAKGTLNIARRVHGLPAIPEPSTAGAPDALQKREAAPVLRDVPEQPVEQPGKVPAEKGAEGVPPGEQTPEAPSKPPEDVLGALTDKWVEQSKEGLKRAYSEKADAAGLAMETQQDLDANRSAFEKMDVERRAALERGDVQTAMELGNQTQFLNEAHGAATGTKSSGRHQFELDPEYKPKFPQGEETLKAWREAMEERKKQGQQVPSSEPEFEKPESAKPTEGKVAPVEEVSPLQVGNRTKRRFRVKESFYNPDDEGTYKVGDNIYDTQLIRAGFKLPEAKVAEAAKVEPAAAPAAAKVEAEVAKVALDPIESRLLDWIERTDPLKSGLMEGVTGAPVWMTKTVANTALRAGLAAYRTGKKLAVAIEAAVEHLRSLNLTGFKENEARAWVTEQLEEPSPIKTAIESAETGRKQIVTLFKSGKVKEAMAYTRDAADVKASVVGTQAANDVRGPIRRLFGKKDAPLAEDALAFVIESQRASANLDAMAKQILDSPNASTKWRNRAIRAIEFAKSNFEKLSRVADRYEQLTDRQLNQEERAGFDTPRRAGYVMHSQDLDTGLGFPDLAAGDGVPTAFRKQRTHAKFSDSIAAGIDPKTLNAVDLLQSRVRAGQRMINRKAWVDSLKDVSDPTNKLPIGTELEVVKNPDGSTQQQAPFGYHVESAGNQLIAVQNGYRGIFEALTNPSVFSHDAFGQALVKANQTGKSISLFFDTFHLGRIAYWESLIKAAGIKTFKLPVPSFKKGVTLLDYSISEINRMAETGEIPKHWLNDLVQEKRKLDLALKTGANFGTVADALHQEWIQKIPGIGKYNRWLFEQFQRGAMTEIWSLEFDRQRVMYKDLIDEQVARRVSKDVNTRFGNLGRQGWIKSRTGQDIARLLALAPQWNEGLISSEVGALRQLGETVVDAATGKRLASGLLLRSVGGMLVGQFVANQLINLYTRGHPTWENKEEGIGAKLSAWIPDKVGGGSGFFLHPAGLAAEITHLILKKYEQTGDFRKAVVDFTRSRASALTRPLWVLATAHDTIGRPLKPGDVITDALKTAVPKPIPSSAVVGAVKQGITGQPSETFPGQYQKQMMASAGVKTDQVPSDEQRIRSLAKKFNAAKGITPSAEFYTGDYQNLSNALRIGNKTEAQKELQDLLKKKQPAVIFKHFSEQFRHPFTGQRARETEFLRTLTKEQADTYRKAVQQRLELSKKAIDLLNENLGTGRSQQPNRDLEILRSMAR